MKTKRLAGLGVGLLSVVICVPALAAGPTVRVEGSDATLLARSEVTAAGNAVVKDGDPAHSCAGNSAAGALERAAAGDWAGRWTSFGGYQIDTIKGQTHTSDAGAPSGTYWAFWLNYRYSSTGACDTTVQDGDDLVFFPDCFGAGCTNPTPLRLAVPAQARPGEQFEARVTEYGVSFDENFNATTTERPSEGATVTLGTQTATTGADGIARLAGDGSAERVELRAAKAGHVRTATEVVCITAGADGRCGTRDTSPPVAGFGGIAEGQRFAAGQGPRQLSGTVASDPSGLLRVKLRLTRRHRGRCAYFSGSLERFRPTRCGRRFWFAIGDRQDWSYLLPERLGPGHYVLDVTAIDRAGNRDPLARGRTRVVFDVR